MLGAYTKHVRRYAITPYVLVNLFTTGHGLQVVEGIPVGAELVGAGYESTKDHFYLLVEHESFDPVEWGDTFPEGLVQLKAEWP